MNNDPTNVPADDDGDVGSRDESEVDTADLAHLRSAVRAIAVLPAPQRIRHIRTERWIGYPRARAVIEHLEIVFMQRCGSGCFAPWSTKL